MRRTTCETCGEELWTYRERSGQCSSCRLDELEVLDAGELREEAERMGRDAGARWAGRRAE